MEEKNQQTHWIFWVIAVIAACLITGLIVYNNTDQIDRFVNNTETIESLETPIEDTTVVEESIADVLQWREYLKEQRRIDSVYLKIPDVVLIDILLQHGTSISNEDIVYIYEAYPETYNLIQSGAKAQKYADSLKAIKPDKLPDKPKHDTLTAIIDSIISRQHLVR